LCMCHVFRVLANRDLSLHRRQGYRQAFNKDKIYLSSGFRLVFRVLVKTTRFHSSAPQVTGESRLPNPAPVLRGDKRIEAAVDRPEYPTGDGPIPGGPERDAEPRVVMARHQLASVRDPDNLAGSPRVGLPNGFTDRIIGHQRKCPNLLNLHLVDIFPTKPRFWA